MLDRRLLPLLFLLPVLFPLASHAAGPAPATIWRAPLDCPLAAHGWREMRFEGRAANQLRCRDGALRISSKNSVSLDYIRPPASFAMAGQLSWDWRVRRSGGPSDLSRKGADDRNITVMVAFRYDPTTASLKERLLRPMVEAQKGADAPGRVLAYTWGGGKAANSPPHRMIDSPFGGAAHRIIELRRGPGPWTREKIDLARDYRAAFGVKSYQIQHIAVAADTDDLGGSAEALIRDLELRL